MAIFRVSAFQVSLRAAVAASLAYWVAELLSAEHAIYALISAVIVTDLSVAKSRRLAIHRMAGTVIGAIVGALFVEYTPNGPIATGAAIFVSMAIVFACRFETPAARVAGYVAAIVMTTYGGDSWHYAFERAWETMVGIGSALLVGLVPLWLREREERAEPK